MQNYKLKFKRAIPLKRAVEFHGHLGPYLVLGILAGEIALSKLACKKHFGLEVKVWGVNKKPKSCFIDGLQLSTGATYGKGNIEKLNGKIIKAEFRNLTNRKKITLRFQDNLIQELNIAKTHKASELLATKLYKTDCAKPFNLTTNDDNR